MAISLYIMPKSNTLLLQIPRSDHGTHRLKFTIYSMIGTWNHEMRSGRTDFHDLSILPFLSISNIFQKQPPICRKVWNQLNFWLVNTSGVHHINTLYCLRNFSHVSVCRSSDWCTCIDLHCIPKIHHYTAIYVAWVPHDCCLNHHVCSLNHFCCLNPTFCCLNHHG